MHAYAHAAALPDNEQPYDTLVLSKGRRSAFRTRRVGRVGRVVLVTPHTSIEWDPRSRTTSTTTTTFLHSHHLYIHHHHHHHHHTRANIMTLATYFPTATAQLPTVERGYAVPADTDVKAVATRAVADLATAADKADADAFAALFDVSGFWRDVLAFTRDLRAFPADKVKEVAEVSWEVTAVRRRRRGHGRAGVGGDGRGGGGLGVDDVVAVSSPRRDTLRRGV